MATAAVGTAQNLTVAGGSPAGQAVIERGYVLIQDLSAVGGATSTAGACYSEVLPGGAVHLADDTGTFGFVNTFVGNSWTNSPSNGHCALDGPGSSVVTVGSAGASEQVTLKLTFNNAAWSGKTLAVWMSGRNTNYQTGGWQQVGVFKVN